MADVDFLPDDAAEGGERKSFWEHINDLRRALVRSAIAIGIALIVCLFLDDKLVAILEYPLRRMDIFEKEKPTVTFQLGATKFGPFEVTKEEFPALPDGVAPRAIYHLGVMQVADQQVLTLKLDPNGTQDDSLKVRLHNLGPAEAFFIAFHIALYGAFVLAAPFWIYYMGGFLLPALKDNERKSILQWLGWGVFLFVLGVTLTYFVLLPVALKASMQYSNILGFASTDWRAEEYIRFVCKFILGMGIGFQFPLVVLFLVKLGMLTYRDLAKYRRHVIVLVLILGALLTTPEVITQVSMAVPLYLLYETCIWIAWYWDWKKRRAGGIIET